MVKVYLGLGKNTALLGKDQGLGYNKYLRTYLELVRLGKTWNIALRLEW